jgi:thimet oligopeptidase
LYRPQRTQGDPNVDVQSSSREATVFTIRPRSQRTFQLRALPNLFFAIAIAFLSLTSATGKAQTLDPLHVWNVAGDPASLEAWVNQRLAAAQADVDSLVRVTGPRTLTNTLRAYDDAMNELTIASNEAYLMFAVGDSAALRDKAQEMTKRITSATTDLSLNQKVYRALKEEPTPKQDAAAAHYLERSLLEYRLAGVDRDEATRAKIRQFQDRITEVSLTFSRNVADDVRQVTATKAELDGLPDDYIARHKPTPEGIYTLTTDPPDSSPVYSFAKDPGLRLRMYVADHQRAYPKNKAVLMDLLKARQDLATTLGFATFADLSTADQMIGTQQNVKTLLQQVEAVSQGPADHEHALLLALARKQQPGLANISLADTSYWSEQYRRSTYNFDAQSVRPYFPYVEVQAGILATAARLFHLEFKEAPAAKVWAATVSTFDVYDNAESHKGKKLGRIYLDMHPREGKDKWFSSYPVVPGIGGQQLPEGALICNFPGGKAGDPGLMEYQDVVIFFHEFGHLVHYILAGQNQWAGAGGFNVEGDFVEAPSQMLEEMVRDPTILSSFAKHYQTGATIPRGLVDRMNAAGTFGRADFVQMLLFYSTYSLQLHNRPPAEIDLDALLQQDLEKFYRYSLVQGDERYASFIHLTGYASNFYSYVLDKVIGLDFFSQFDKTNILEGPAAMRYRRAVLEPGATKPGSELVKDFLGRPQSINALAAWLGEEFSQKNR